MEKVDITTLSYNQLGELRARAEQRMTELRDTGTVKLREAWAEQAAAIGMTIEEIMGGGKPRVRRRGRNDESVGE